MGSSGIISMKKSELKEYEYIYFFLTPLMTLLLSTLSSENQISWARSRTGRINKSQLCLFQHFFICCVVPPLFTTSTACCGLHCIVSDGVENRIGVLFTLEKCSYTPPPPPNKKKNTWSQVILIISLTCCWGEPAFRQTLCWKHSGEHNTKTIQNGWNNIFNKNHLFYISLSST